MKQYMIFIKDYVSKYSYDIIACIFLSLIYVALSMTSPILSQYLIDNVLVKSNESNLRNLLILLIIALIFTTLVFVLYNIISIRTFNKIGYNLRTSLFKHLNLSDISLINELPAGLINYRLFVDAEVLKNSLGQWLFSIINNFAIVAFILIYMFILNWKLAGFVMLIISPSIIVILKFRKPILDCSVERKKKTELIMARIIEIFTSFHLIKACGRELKEVSRFNNNLEHVTNISIREQLLSLMSSSICNVISMIASFFVLGYGGLLVIRGQITLGSFMAFLLVCGMFISPIGNLIGAITSFQNIKASVNRVYDTLKIPSKIKNKQNALKPNIDGNIVFRDVEFGYSQATHILKNISLEIHSKTIVSIVGRSGIGKTTLCSLVARFYDPISGSIYIDGHDLKDIDIDYYRNNVGLVLQNCFLISGTIAENISFGNASLCNEEVKKAAKLANAHDFIERLPDGYWTEVGERGIQLSGGEAQRIAIARLFLQQPKIAILDEATSFVDLESEEYIHDAIKRLSERSTVLIVTHKLSTAKLASQIIALDNGMIVDCGTHDELISKNGTYASFYRKILS